MQRSISVQTDMTSESDIESVYEDKIDQIKDKYQETIDTVNEAFQLATKNFLKKCRDFDFVSDQLKGARSRNQHLKQQLSHSNIALKVKNEEILELQRVNKKLIREKEEIAEIKEMLHEMIEYEKRAIEVEEQEKRVLTLTNILAVEKKQPPLDSANNVATNRNLLNSNKKFIKLYNFASLVKAECEKSALKLQKTARTCENKSNDSRKGNSDPSPQELLRRQSDKIKLLKSQMNHEKERAEKIFVRNKTKFEKELNEEKAYRSQIKTKLERIISKNRAVIDEWNRSREGATRGTENATSGSNQLKDPENTLKCMEKECDELRGRVSFSRADIDQEKCNTISVREIIPRYVLDKIREMNINLSGIVEKNRQLTETVKILTAERQEFHLKIQELKKSWLDRDETAKQTWQRYNRAERFRRALIHQKNYLMIVVNSYERAAIRLTLIGMGMSAMKFKKVPPKLKSVALAIVAALRMGKIYQRTRISGRKRTNVREGELQTQDQTAMVKI